MCVAIFHDDLVDVSALRILFGAGDPAFDTGDTARFREVAHKLRIKRCIELERIGDAGQGCVAFTCLRALELACFRREVLQAIGVNIRRLAHRVIAVPEMVKAHALHRGTILAKGMDIALAQTPPIDELNTQLERRIRLANKIVFIKPQQTVEIGDVRDGRFADPDCANGLAFN